MGKNRKNLSDILSEGQQKSYFSDWDKVKAAGDFIIPKGEYEARWIDGYGHQAKTGTNGFKLVFEIAEGEQAGRKLYHDLWLTQAAKSQTKRDFDELGVTDPENQLKGSIPQGVIVLLQVVVRKDDDDIEQNRIRRIKFLRVEPGDAFEPKAEDNAAETFDPATFDKPMDAGPTNGSATLPLPRPTDGPYGKGGEGR